MTATALKPGRVEQLPVGKLAPDPGQPRKAFDEKALAALADNIKARGILQPILVRSLGIGGYQIVDGERRWRAAKLAKLKQVPVMLSHQRTDLVEIRVDQVAANNLREQLTEMEQARFLRDLRDSQKLSANEIAATLEKHGMKALGRKDIEARLLLTDLPDWAQAMIDGEQLEVGAAPAILRGAKIPGIAAGLRKHVEARVGWRGIVTDKDAWDAVARAAEDKHKDLTKVESYYPDPVHFDHKTRCKGCEHYQAGRGFAVCTSATLFTAHNQEAKDAGLGPGGRRQEPKALAGAREEKAKTEQREHSIERTAQEYLHRWLLRLIDSERLYAQPAIESALLMWAAARQPGGWGIGQTPQRIATMWGVERTQAVSERWDSLKDFLSVPASQHADPECLIARQILDSLDFGHLLLVARHLYGESLAAFWLMDAEFPKLFRKAEIIAQLTRCGAQPPEGTKAKNWEAMKTSDLHAAMLANATAIGVPTILIDLYSQPFLGPNERYVSERDEDDDDSVDALMPEDPDDDE